MPSKQYTVGLDVSLKKVNICVKDSEGRVVKETEVEANPSAIDRYLSAHFAKNTLKKVGLETGQLTIYLYKELSKLGYKVIMMESYDVSQKIKGAKTDKRDARCIADFLRANLYKEVHVKATHNQRHRTLLNLRVRCIGGRVKHANAIRGSLKDYGYKLGACSASKYRERIYEMLEDDTELLDILLPTLALLDSAIEEEARYTKMILTIAKEHSVMRRMMTMPGVGPITAFAFVATIDNPLRFSKTRSVGAYLGLTPKVRQSGEVDSKGGITKSGDKIMRSLLVESAGTMLYSCKDWNTVRSWGANICKKRSTTRIAVIAMARKMACIMHRMWIEEMDFCPSRKALEARAAA